MDTITVTLPVDMAPLAGPLLLGYMFNWALYGALCIQMYIYNTSFPNDRNYTKLLVYGVFAVETAQTLIITRDAFTTYARGFGQLEALNSAQTEWLATPILSSIVSCTVQLYYAYRLYILSNSWIITGCVSLIALLQGSAGIAQGVQAFQIGNFSDLDSVKTSCIVWLAGSATCDIIIAVSMTYLLLHRDSRMPATHTVVMKLVHLVVETGMLTATAATLDLILFLAFPHNAYHGCIALTLAKLYSNSLMVIFNNRLHLKRAQANTFTLDKSLTNGSSGRAPVSLSSAGATIQVQQETWVETDQIPMEDRSVKKAHSLSDSVAV